MRQSFKVAVLAAIGIFATEAEAAATQDSCKALALSGGASNGAWEVGVLWGLINYGTPSDYAYDVVTGVSVGSINSLFMAGWPKGQEVEMIQAGSDLWNNMTTDQVWKNWALSPVMGLTSKQGFLNNRPLLDFLKNMTDQFDRFYKRITVSALNFSTGQVEFFNQKNTPLEEFHKAAFASTCIPGAFPNYAWEQADGSTKYYSDNFMIGNINPDSAIKQCLELVDDESKITIDVLLLGNMRDFETYPEHTGGWFENKHHLKSYGNFMRSRQIKYQHSNSNSIVQWIRRRPNVNWRYIVQQENAVSGLDMLRFSADNTWPLQEEGRKVAYDILSNPTNYGKEAYLAWNSESFGQEEDSLL